MLPVNKIVCIYSIKNLHTAVLNVFVFGRRRVKNIKKEKLNQYIKLCKLSGESKNFTN